MIRSRIAPTPSGYLHTGNALNFVLTWLWVRKEGGKLRLRIDDLDTPRARAEYVDDIFRTLEFLGLDWDEGPFSVEQQQLEFSQSLREDKYRQFLDELIAAQAVFACSCSRKDIAEQSANEQYPGTCRLKQLDVYAQGPALRLLTPVNTLITAPDVSGKSYKVDLYNTMRDFVVKRKDGIAAYQVASLVDDLDYGINLIIRGSDLLPSTAAQLYLSQLTHKSNFTNCAFYHHPLITDSGGQKLSKSAGNALQKKLSEGSDPSSFFEFMCAWLNWPQKFGRAQQMLAAAKNGLPLIKK